ncbi:hypothetical protein CAF53_08765 [Sphingobium sp. LB126]|uniref:hypothetical protein n=1 Tax=Sphingobium sp. LB126 TaxID=1983755 RepID=UPI000C205C40|nr:hypothetical protein [Sphingobium sp. LB126]PJG48320.1 hypothetical protein CAF53_08765 [Sphingobium sp. LB126]
MSTKVYSAAGERLSRIDMSDHLACIDETATERGKIDAAIERGMADIGELGRRINEARFGPHVDADKAADALLSGGDVTVEVDTIERLELERAANTAGMKRLREREAVAGQEEAAAKNAACSAVAACVADLPPVLMQEAEAAAGQLAAVFAAAVALAEGAASPAARGVADKLREVVAKCSTSGLIRHSQLAVPDATLAVLEAGRRPIEQLGRRWPVAVSVPGPAINPALVAMGEENRLLRDKIASLQAA